MQAAEAAAVRHAVSAAPPSRPRSRPVALSSTITSALIAGRPVLAIGREDADELDARAVEAGAVGRHDVDEAVGARVDGRLGRQLDRAVRELDEHRARELGGLGGRRQQRRDLGVAQPARLRGGHCALVVACARTCAASSRARAATRARSGSGSSRTASPR